MLSFNSLDVQTFSSSLVAVAGARVRGSIDIPNCCTDYIRETGFTHDENRKFPRRRRIYVRIPV